jgi:Flp pilus assembly protein TadD
VPLVAMVLLLFATPFALQGLVSNSARSVTSLTAAIEALEARQISAARTPATDLLLAQAKVDKLLAGRMLADVRQLRGNPVAEDAAFAELNAGVVEMARRLDLTTDTAEMERTQAEAHALLAKLYDAPEIGRRRALAVAVLYGYVLAIKGDRQRAGDCLKVATALGRGDPRVDILKAALLERAGEFAQARGYNRNARERLHAWVLRHPQEVAYVPGSFASVLPQALENRTQAIRLMEGSIRRGLVWHDVLLRLKAAVRSR